MAVPIFMIISGYVYSKSFERHNIGTFEAAYSFKSIMQKIIRFTVPFLFAYIIEEAAYIVIGQGVHPIKSIYRFLIGGVGPGAYYFPVMIQFIFYFPVVYFIINKHGEKGFLGCIAINFIYELFQCAYSMNEECYRMLVFRYTLLIAFGCYMAVNQMRINTKMLFIFEATGITYIILFKYIGLDPPITIYWTGTSYLASMYIIPIAFLIMNKTKLSIKPLEMLGKASYDIFLVQMVWYAFGVSLLYKFIGNSIIQLICCIVICCVGGVVFYYVESRVTKMIVNRLFIQIESEKSVQ